MTPNSILLLEFHPERHDLGKGKEMRDGLSVALQIGNTLWVANDETISLERLTLEKGDDGGDYRYARDHMQFALDDYLRLPVPPTGDPADLQEVDIEGLAYDDGYLWLVGSHSLKRSKPDVGEGVRKAQKQLARLSAENNRYLLARIPVVESDGTFTLAKESVRKGNRQCAAQLRARSERNDLMDVLVEDEHLASFLSIPGKDNGFDIEGLAVAGKRVFVGLRGPVLRGWAIILELALKEDKEDPSILKLKRIGPDGRRYRKHFLNLGGLGIRDLAVQGSDLLILAGPSMDLDGPVTVFRWVDGTEPKGECMLDEKDMKRVIDVPFGQGVDHAEGICLFSADGGKAKSLLVVYDAACVSRQVGECSLAADVFHLP
ncbi:MAG TPA: DUF3616 domain-containing protein [Noviherbaspirillum sp.]|jgi:hypothetical protein|uniref:DUF3616 domain-containing protein n=1 Tax=Noviherbaspirillum sp. TaxID=1926288 RepID=UPI002DDD83FE|nr:DUF3616 domain-containing protein [Noviherbaspirillum sp.]HEV2611006.1 DUF3616 domain-containing protein [Noviherbaspirillum sp.]